MGTIQAGGCSIYYEYYDAAHLALAPARLSAATAQLVFGNPLSPLAYTLPGRVINASADVFSGFTRRRGKPAWNLPAAIEVVDEQPFARLIRFVPDRAPERALPRVLLVAPLSGHYATLLRSTVEELMTGHDVYVTDWADARDVPLAAGRFDFDDYIGYLIGYLRRLGPDVHVVAVCQPCPAVMAAVALMAADGDPAQPRSMTLMGGPVDVRVAPTAPTEFAAGKDLAWFERELTMRVPHWYRGGGRRVYPGFLQLGAFMSMNQDRHVDAHAKIFADLVRGDGESARSRRAFYDEYLSVMDMTAEFYLETVDVVFQRASLARGHADLARPAGRPRGDPRHRAAHRRGRARRHLGAGPDLRGAGAVQRHPGRAARPPAPAGRRPLRHLRRSPLARHDRAAHRRVRRGAGLGPGLAGIAGGRSR